MPPPAKQNKNNKQTFQYATEWKKAPEHSLCVTWPFKTKTTGGISATAPLKCRSL
jgi:hypothetical protein